MDRMMKPATARMNARGFSMVELIIGIILVGVLGLFSMGYLGQIMQINQLTEGQKDLLDESKLAMELFIREFRMSRADTIQCGNPAGACAVGTPYTQVTFGKLFAYQKEPCAASPCATSPLDPAIADIVFSYDSIAKTVTRTNTAATVLARNVTAFSITQAEANLYRIEMTLNGPNGENYTLRGAVRPRSTITIA